MLDGVCWTNQTTFNLLSDADDGALSDENQDESDEPAQRTKKAVAKVLHQDGRNCFNTNTETGLLKRMEVLCVKD